MTKKAQPIMTKGWHSDLVQKHEQGVRKHSLCVGNGKNSVRARMQVL